MENLKNKLYPIISDFIPNIISIKSLQRLSGGSSNESWKVTITTKENDQDLVFRRESEKSYESALLMWQLELIYLSFSL